MYAYWAYRLIILASDAKSNWPEITQSAKESERSWILLREMVRDTNVRLLLEGTSAGWPRPWRATTPLSQVRGPSANRLYRGVG